MVKIGIVQMKICENKELNIYTAEKGIKRMHKKRR